MPCNCDHMEPTQHEMESKKVAIFIVDVSQLLGRHPSDAAVNASQSYYGDRSKVHTLTAELCKLMEEKVTQDTVMPLDTTPILKLKLWWIAHQEADVIKDKEATALKRSQDIKQSAINKLTSEEREELGL